MGIKPVYILLAILTIATVFFYQDPQSNGNSRLAAVRAVVEQDSFQIDPYIKEPAWSTCNANSQPRVFVTGEDAPGSAR